jgi:hypothetical protein
MYLMEYPPQIHLEEGSPLPILSSIEDVMLKSPSSSDEFSGGTGHPGLPL